MKKETLSRLKATAKLESLITSGADYNTIIKQSQKIDRYITEEMKKRLTTEKLQNSDKYIKK